MFGCEAFWSSTATRLASRSYAVDWYSLGNGNWSAYASPDGPARAALLLLDAIGVQQVDIVGNSVGGIVAQILAYRHPDRVRRLVLVGTGASLAGPPHRFGELVAAWIDQRADRCTLVAAGSTTPHAGPNTSPTFWPESRTVVQSKCPDAVTHR